MIAQLTGHERQLAILISLVVAIVRIAARHRRPQRPDRPAWRADLRRRRAGRSALIGRDYLRAGALRRRGLRSITTIPTKAGIVLAMVWVVFGLAVGDWVAWQLVYPDLTFGQALVELRPAAAGAHHAASSSASAATA